MDQQPDLFVAPSRRPRARHTSYKAAVRVQLTRKTKTRAYLQLLFARGPLTDHEAYSGLRETVLLAFSSIQSIRAQLMTVGLVDDSGTTAPSPFGNQNVRWGLTAAGIAAVQAMKGAA